jgi:hypothetical protein
MKGYDYPHLLVDDINEEQGRFNQEQAKWLDSLDSGAAYERDGGPMWLGCALWLAAGAMILLAIFLYAC